MQNFHGDISSLTRLENGITALCHLCISSKFITYCG